MPHETSLPLDDKTLFILLRLKYNKQVEINRHGLIYDRTVNYDDTLIKPDCTVMSLPAIQEAGIKWIIKKFKVTQKASEQSIFLYTEHTEDISQWLSEYLKSFPHDKRYYFNEEKHRRRLYNFIKEKEPDVLEYEGKYYTYKYLPETDKEKYKMIEYIALLIEQEILSADEKTFAINTSEGRQQTSIYTRFVSSNSIQELFNDYFSEEERSRIAKKIEAEQPLCESEKWSLYAGNKIYYKPEQRAGQIPPRYYNLFKFCIERGNRMTVTPNIYSQYSGTISPEVAAGYFSELNSNIKKALGLDIKVLKSKGKHIWEINV